MRTNDQIKQDAKQILRDVISGIELEENRLALRRHAIHSDDQAHDYVKFHNEIDECVARRLSNLVGRLVDLSQDQDEVTACRRRGRHHSVSAANTGRDS